MRACSLSVPAATPSATNNAIRVKSRANRAIISGGRRRAGAVRVRADGAAADGWSDSTQAVHHGERGGRPRVSDSLTTPVCMTSTYWFKDTEELIAYQEGRYGSFEYGRYGNPTSRACEEKIRLLEGGEDCLLSASGEPVEIMRSLFPNLRGEPFLTLWRKHRRTPRRVLHAELFVSRLNARALRCTARGAVLVIREAKTLPTCTCKSSREMSQRKKRRTPTDERRRRRFEHVLFLRHEQRDLHAPRARPRRWSHRDHHRLLPQDQAVHSDHATQDGHHSTCYINDIQRHKYHNCL